MKNILNFMPSKLLVNFIFISKRVQFIFWLFWCHDFLLNSNNRIRCFSWILLRFVELFRKLPWFTPYYYRRSLRIIIFFEEVRLLISLLFNRISFMFSKQTPIFYEFILFTPQFISFSWSIPYFTFIFQLFFVIIIHIF